MDLQDHFPALYVRQRDIYLTVKAARPKKRRIQYIGPVGGGYQDDAFVRFKAVHFHKKLVQCLFPFIMAAAQSCTAVPSDGINFVDEDDTGGIFFTLHKKIPDPGCAHTHEHFYKIRSADTEKGNIRFSGNGT